MLRRSQRGGGLGAGVWCFLGGLAPGALAALAFGPPAWPLARLVAAGALAGGALALLVAALARRGSPERGRALAAAAGLGHAGWPALGAAWLGLAPGPRALAGAVLLLLFGALLARAARAPAGRASPARAAALGLAGGALAALVAGGAWARLGAVSPVLGGDAAAGIFDLDARIAPRPLPRCGPAPTRVEVLLERGAHPRLTRDGAALWFDAPGPDGRRQVHRLLLPGGEVACFTCGEPGENRRPDPSDTGTSVLFESDRDRSARTPSNTNLRLISARGEPGSRASRQLTFDPGRDDHALFAPDGRSLLWSRGADGRFDVVAAAFSRGHGGLLLTAPRVVVAGGSAWVAPLAWSPDARALVVGRGGPRRPFAAELLDPANGALAALGPLAGAAFSADGGRIALTRAPGAAGPGLRAGLGFLLGPLAVARGGPPAAPPGPSALETGDTGAEAAPVELGPEAAWGAPTGVALGPAGDWLVLGQRRAAAAGGVEERLLRVTLDCDA
jgi:hypothetical protein